LGLLEYSHNYGQHVQIQSFNLFTDSGGVGRADPRPFLLGPEMVRSQGTPLVSGREMVTILEQSRGHHFLRGGNGRAVGRDHFVVSENGRAVGRDHFVVSENGRAVGRDHFFKINMGGSRRRPFFKNKYGS
jgi:hypothetical protein